jgi:hypothetical protein
MILATTTLLMAGMALQAGQAPTRQAPTREVTVEVMTCAQLKAEGDRQMAIMRGGTYEEAIDDMVDNIDMQNLGERQGRRSVALGALQAASGLAGNAAGVARAADIHDTMNKADKVERDAILARGHARQQANEKIENQAGEHFTAITEQYRRRGCAGRGR